MVYQRFSQGRPWISAISWVILIGYFFADSRRAPLVFVMLGFALGTASWSNRFLGRSVGWELPVHRPVLQRLRIVGGLIVLAIMVMVLTPLIVYPGLRTWSGEPLTILVTGMGGGVVGFTIGFILGQVSRTPQSVTFIVGFLLLFLLTLLPARFLLWILPEAAHGTITGRHGLKTFTGGSLLETFYTGAAPGVWSLQNWLGAALVWGAICLGLLFVVSGTHQE